MNLWSSITLALATILLVYSESDKENVKIKIVEAPALSRFPTMPTSHGNKALTLRADPSPLSGPPHLQQLNNHCYTGKDKGYTYRICLFNNITQKEDRIGWNSFHGVLGVWHEWIIENDTFTGMHYTMGESCDSSQREAVVLLKCSPSTKVYNFTEPKTCSYHMILDTPLACFKGPMQVYHLLSSEQLKQWDDIEQLYYAEEITFQGLTKKRRKLLVEAGLLQKGDKVEKTPAPQAEQPSSTPPDSQALENCHQNVLNMQNEIYRMHKQMQTLESDVLRIAKNYPELHHNLELLLNITSPITTEPSTSSQQPPLGDLRIPHGKDASPEENFDDALLLTDEILDNLADNLDNADVENVGAERVISKKDVIKKTDDEELEALIKDVDIDELYKQ